MISNSTTLRTGETALLACVSFGEPDVEISWSFNGAPVVNTSLVTIYEEGVVQGERIFKQSFLQICSLAETDDGGYTCIASDGFTTDNATTQLTVTRKFINVLFLLLNFFFVFFLTHNKYCLWMIIAKGDFFLLICLFVYRFSSSRGCSDIQ